ncbi:MAG: hypothetical protein P8Q92_13545 [Pseudoprimorskyibacter sp.]|nr:hypothetical protein [Pseudoprimorskyibacter sp.]
MEHDRPDGVDAEPQVTKPGPQSVFTRIIIFPIDTTFNVYDQQRKSGTDPIDPIAGINILEVVSAEMYYFFDLLVIRLHGLPVMPSLPPVVITQSNLRLDRRQ